MLWLPGEGGRGGFVGGALVVSGAVASLLIAGCVQESVCEVVVCAVLTECSRVVCMQRPLIPVEFRVSVHGFAAPPAGCAVGVGVDESGAGFVVCPAAALLGFGEFAVLHGLGPLGVCWWMCEGSNLMDQRVLAFVKVGLWLADCSPVESHPCCIVLLMLNVLRVALSCRFAVALVSPCRAC